MSLGWSIYSLLDHYPRLVRFGSIWEREFRKKGKHFGPMLTGWAMILFLVLISLSGLVRGAFHFGQSGWDRSEWFPLIFGLIGLALFIVPMFINRAVWSLILFVFSEHFKLFVEEPQNQLYWEARFSIETACKLYSDPKKFGGKVFGESFVLVVFISWAVSSFYPKGELAFDVYQAFWIFAPSIALLAAGFLHWAWPADVTVDPKMLPPALRQKIEQNSLSAG